VHYLLPAHYLRSMLRRVWAQTLRDSA